MCFPFTGEMGYNYIVTDKKKKTDQTFKTELPTKSSKISLNESSWNSACIKSCIIMNITCNNENISDISTFHRMNLLYI